ncbi:MAG: bifunctional hydroxymethylpyrimidine kinase/phosphomethylpyrimidine kinase [Deferribacteraceae bacterium]|nr:bifunctional hydroxymethylpyrimidine kinase/phosphomethylpyrimidine kinase [Deferribacteraceae bacterium]
MKKSLTIATSDSGGCAGIQADLKTFSALGVFGMSVIAAVTAQNTLEVKQIATIPIDNIAMQIDAVFEDIGADSVKIGMLFSKEIIDVVAKGLEKYEVKNLVVDPVMVAATGALLLKTDAINTMIKKLFPLARVVTPNLHEAEALSGIKILNYKDKVEACKIISRRGAQTVILKGGHGSGAESVDLWYNGKSVYEFSAPRVDTENVHGTGCTFSAAITAYLAHGCTLDESIRKAKIYITNAILKGKDLRIGRGSGPVNHFWNISDELR